MQFCEDIKAQKDSKKVMIYTQCFFKSNDGGSRLQTVCVMCRRVVIECRLNVDYFGIEL